jgi:D123
MMPRATRQVVIPTYIENWPIELRALSMPSESLALTRTELIALGQSQVELGPTFWEEKRLDYSAAPIVHGLAEELHAKIRRVMQSAGVEGVFVRLGSRSPKDSYWWWHHEDRDGLSAPWPITSGADAMNLLRETSERVNDDLLEAYALNYSPHIWVRAWENIDPATEFRCFVKGRNLLAISQYDYMGGRVYPQLTRDRALYVSAIKTLFSKRIKPVLHMDDVVVDMYVRITQLPSGRGRKASATLLELNPYFELTDPCLFTWEDLEKYAEMEMDDIPVVKIREEPQ